MDSGSRNEAERLQFFLTAWQEKPPALELPIDTRPSDPRSQSRSLAASAIDPLLWQQAVSTSSALAVDPALLIYGALHVVLHRYTGQTFVWTGWQAAGGTENEPLLPVCSDLPIQQPTDDPVSLRTFLLNLRDRLAQHATYAPVPWDALGRQMGIGSDTRGLLSVVFQAQCLTSPAAAADLASDDFAGSKAPSAGQALFVRLLIGSDRAAARITLLDRQGARHQSTLQRMIGHLLEVLREAVEHVDRPAASVSMLTSAERAQLSSWNDTTRPFPDQLCVHHLFEAQAARTPDAVALVCGDERLTYRQLDQRANDLAPVLRRQGAGPDVLIGLFLERSVDMAVAVLAVLKAGSAYVPLDPAYPRERLAFLCADTQTPIVLTQQRLQAQLPATAARVLCVDRELPMREDNTPQAVVDLDRPSVLPHHVAYVIYTSGSTGQPKGICLPHRALVNLICWHDRTLLRAARTLQFASLSFDASFHEMFAAWQSGGSVYLISETLRRDVHALSRFIQQEQIEKAILPVVVLQQLAEQHRDDVGGMRCLRELTTTGEQLHITPAIVQLFERLPDCRLHNHYGPSETHVVTALQLDHDPHTWPSHPSIGTPIDNCTTYILDRYGQQTPVGVVGELYLGGVCLAHGYLHREALTAERFLTGIPQAGISQRLYRTGDLARFSADGTIEFLGRIDHQIKLRGFRIEPGEVEAALTAHREIAEAAVLVREDLPGDRRLVAYVVPQPNAVPSRTGLRAYLNTRLPAFMVPASIVVVPHMPLNANGKIDRRALPVPDRLRPDLEPEFVAPSSELEITLTEIFVDALHIEGIGVHDSLLALGGDSLTAMRILGRIRQQLWVEVPFDTLLATPTVSSVARAVAELQAQYAGSETASSPSLGIPVLPAAARHAAPLSFAQERMWFLHKLHPGSPLQTCFYAFRLHGSLNIEALSESVQGLVARHEILRTLFPDQGREPRPHILPALFVPIERASLGSVPADQRDSALGLQLQEQAARPFDLAHGPLLRIGIITVSPDDHVLWWSLHHIITDGRSMEVLFRELSEHYNRHRIGGTGPRSLPSTPLQYVDFAAWERRHQTEEALRQHVQFWRDKLADVPHQIALPADHPRPAIQSHRGFVLRVHWPAAFHASLRALAAASRSTLSMVVLAGLSAVIHRYTGAEKFILGIPSLGRDRVELEDLVGFFVNIVPVRIDIRAEQPFSALLARVRDEMLEAFTHDALPFDKLVHELHIERNPSHSPLIQIALAPQPPERDALSLHGVVAQPVELDSHSARFDLTIFLRESSAGCELAFEASSDLFERESIERLATHLQNVLSAAAGRRDEPVGRSAMLSSAELQQLSMLGQRGQRTNEQRPFHMLFASQAALRPQAAALVETGGLQRQWTYRDLDVQSNQLAHHLRRLGVGPEVRVGLLVERGIESVLAILAIWKAGGAYVPLDPDYPADRLAFMLADAAPAVLITQGSLRSRIPADVPTVVCIDNDAAQIAENSQASLPNATQPFDLAYVIYTSGSTGRPKGVAVEAHNLTHLCVAQGEAFGLTASSRVLQFASLCFDASVSEITTTLAAGGALYLLPPGPPVLGNELGEVLRTHRIDVVTLPPSILPHVPRTSCQALHTLIVAGEACAADLVDRWAVARRMINAYGPTETTVCATLGDCRPGAGTPSIGAALPGVTLRVLDSSGNRVPIGVPGELYVGGAGVSRGYLNRPELTADRFVPDPDHDPTQPTARLYRTGDLVRMRSDGQLDFLGRLDQQLKVNGFRIEPGEVEAVLREHPRVGNAAVDVVVDSNGDKRLVAYIVPQASAEPQSRSSVLPAIELWPSVAEYFVYDDLIYFALSSDTLRNDVYRRSMARTLRGRTVLEIGTGAEAVLARMCIEEGARKVYAVEILEASATKARARIAELGLSDRIEVILGDATQVTLPEPADACVSEIVGAIGGSEAAAFIMNQVHSLLSPGARIIPERSITRIAAVELPTAFLDSPSFGATAAHYVEKIFEQVGRSFDLRLCLRGVTPDHLLTDSGVFEDLDFRRPIALEETHDTTLQVTRDGDLSGFLVWLNLYTADEDCIDILAQQRSWLPVFLPVFDTTQHVRAGAQIELQIERSLCSNARNPDYLLRGVLRHADGRIQRFEYKTEHFGQQHCHNRFYERLFASAGSAEPKPATDESTKQAAQSVAVADGNGNSKASDELPSALRALLLSRLPRYMVPSSFVQLSALPLSHTGKIDRRALPSVYAAEQRHAAQAGRAADLGHTIQDEASTSNSQTEVQLARIFSDLLGHERFGPDDSFFDVGGYSLLAARLMLRVQDELAVDVPLRALYETPSVRGLARRLDRRRKDTVQAELCFDPTLDLDSEAQLAPEIIPPAADSMAALAPSQSRALFLTGGTGFVGAFLLAELLEKTASDVQVFCLVRASDRASATARLRTALYRYGIWRSDYESRIQAIPGDLAAPRLGLSEADFAALAAGIDVIYHCGARVDHVRSYASLRAANVGGTHEVLRLACQARRKTLHFISTLSVLYPPSHIAATRATEDDPAGPLALLPNGYMQSKCVAEHLVQRAQARGLDAAIYRLGAVVGHSRSGVCNLGDFFYSALRSVVQLGAADDLDTDQTLVPIDHAVRAVVAIASLPERPARTFHITPARPYMWFELLADLRARGYAIRIKTYAESMQILLRAVRSGMQVPMASFIPFLVQHRAGDAGHYVMCDYYASIAYDSRNTIDALAQAGTEPLPDPHVYARTCLDHLEAERLLASTRRTPVEQAAVQPSHTVEA